MSIYDARRWDEAKSAFEDVAKEVPKESLYELEHGIVLAR